MPDMPMPAPDAAVRLEGPKPILVDKAALAGTPLTPGSKVELTVKGEVGDQVELTYSPDEIKEGEMPTDDQATTMPLDKLASHLQPKPPTA
jgi:hypothetical protein